MKYFISLALILLALLSVMGVGWAEVKEDRSDKIQLSKSEQSEMAMRDEWMHTDRPPTPEEMSVRQGLIVERSTVTAPDLYQIQIQILSDRTVKLQKQIDELRARLDGLPKPLIHWVCYEVEYTASVLDMINIEKERCIREIGFGSDGLVHWRNPPAEE